MGGRGAEGSNENTKEVPGILVNTLLNQMDYNHSEGFHFVFVLLPSVVQ